MDIYIYITYDICLLLYGFINSTIVCLSLQYPNILYQVDVMLSYLNIFIHWFLFNHQTSNYIFILILILLYLNMKRGFITF